MREKHPETYEEKLSHLRELREQAIHSASEAAVEKQHAKGKMTARERIEQPMLLAESSEQPGEIAGLLSWIDGDEVEILTLHAAAQWQGVGTALLEALAERCAERGRERLIVTTTNDNLGALRFYQRRGFRLRALRAGAVDESRSRLKPSIPAEGDDGIPKRDEIELEREL